MSKILIRCACAYLNLLATLDGLQVRVSCEECRPDLPAVCPACSSDLIERGEARAGRVCLRCRYSLLRPRQDVRDQDPGQAPGRSEEVSDQRTGSSGEVECPICGALNQDLWEYLEGTHKVECLHCEGPLTLTVETSATYTLAVPEEGRDALDDAKAFFLASKRNPGLVDGAPVKGGPDA